MKEKLLILFVIMVPATLLVFFTIVFANANATERNPKTACELISFAVVDSMLETQWFYDAGEYLETNCNNKRTTRYAFQRYCTEFLADNPFDKVDPKIQRLCVNALGKNSRFLRPRDN